MYLVCASSGQLHQLVLVDLDQGSSCVCVLWSVTPACAGRPGPRIVLCVCPLVSYTGLCWSTWTKDHCLVCVSSGQLRQLVLVDLDQGSLSCVCVLWSVTPACAGRLGPRIIVLCVCPLVSYTSLCWST